MKKRVHLLVVVTMVVLFGMTFPMLACWGPDCDPCYEGEYCTWECDSWEICCEDGYGDGECCDDDFCCDYACQECCDSTQCTGCETCQSYTCQDDDNECTGCESCVNGQCVDDDNNCSSPNPYCIDAVCKECLNDSDCDTCQRCNQTTHICEDVVVTGISGVSGNYYKGSEETVTATVSGSTLPGGCTIAWGGDASFSNQSGLTATATLDTIDTGNTITAETIVQSPPEESGTYNVAEITQFNADPTKFPVCQNANLPNDYFVVITNPGGFEDDVSITGKTTATAGTHTAYATLWGEPDPPLEASYSVVGSGTWVPVPASQSCPPNPPSGGVYTTNTEIYYRDQPLWGDRWYKITHTYAGPYEWDEIGQATVTAPATYSTIQCTSWGLHETITGTASLNISSIGVTTETTIGGSWEASETHALQSGPDETPYQWRYTHYQQCADINRTTEILISMYGEDGPWITGEEEGITGGPYSEGLQGTTTYLQTKEKKCP